MRNEDKVELNLDCWRLVDHQQEYEYIIFVKFITYLERNKQIENDEFNHL